MPSSDGSGVDRQRLQPLFDISPDAIILHDIEGSIIDVNDRTVDSLGLERAELRTMNVADVERAHSHAELRSLWRGMAPDERETVEGTHRRADGSTFPVEVSIRRIELDGDDYFLTLSRDISERKERERELERYERLVENLPVGVYRCTAGPNGEFRLLNRSMVEMFDADSKAHLREHSVSDLYRDSAEREAFSERLADETVVREREIELETLDGESLWGAVTAIARDVGEETVFDGAIQDVTDRKAFERQLSALHGATREFVEAASKTEVAEIAVETATDLLGFSLPSVWFPTDDRTELVLVANSPEHQALLEEAGTPAPTHPRGNWLWDVFEAGETAIRDSLPRDALAADVPLRSSIVLPLGEHGVLTCAATGTTEFTDREIQLTELLARNVRVALDQIEQQTALKRQKQLIDDLLDGIDDIVYVLDSTGHLRRWNEAFETVTGYDGEALKTMHIADFFGPDDADAAVEAVEEAFETGDTRMELELLTDDGESIPYEFIANTFEDPCGEPALAGIGRDRTVHVEYEQRLREQRDNLELLNQVVRHDIRNDLQLVSSYAELLDERVDDERGYVETIVESAEQAVELTKTARELADVMLATEQGRAAVPLRPALEDELDAIRTAYPEATFSVEGSIPDVDVVADEMLDSVFRNLLKNAVQHNDEAAPTVTVSARTRDDEVVVYVADDGPGVPDDQKEVIFGQGEKGLESGGTGLGLYLVQTLLDAYGGAVWVEDNDPEGAVFVVTLPTAGQEAGADRSVSGT